jgi:pimeloyl-ACP methyl ester carboxylesterase
MPSVAVNGLQLFHTVNGSGPPVVFLHGLGSSSSDWALQGIGPATIPTILALGAEPWEYSVNYVGASVRYYFGSRKLALPE